MTTHLLPLSFRKVPWLPQTLHNPPRYPHWSESVEWRAGRWDPMCNAPQRSHVLEVRGRDKKGKVLEPIHWADGDGDGLMPAFTGWFIKNGNGYLGVEPIEWQPLRAKQNEEDK